MTRHRPDGSRERRNRDMFNDRNLNRSLIHEDERCVPELWKAFTVVSTRHIRYRMRRMEMHEMRIQKERRVCY